MAATALTRRQLFALDFAVGSDPDPTPTRCHVRVHRTAMACRFEVLLGGEDARLVPFAREALDEADRIESLLTVFRETSEDLLVNKTLVELAAVCVVLAFRTGEIAGLDLLIRGRRAAARADAFERAGGTA